MVVYPYMKVIPVKVTNKKASVPMLVNDWDYEILKDHKWRLDGHGYPYTTVKQKNCWAHKIIIWNPKGFEIDHIDHNPLNNQKENLRIVTRSQNRMNSRLNSNNTSGFKGISWNKARQKWRIQIQHEYKGSYSTLEEAIAAYEIFEKEIYGDYAPRK
jgi:hypothetical protein